jgi:hypothetical protein
MSRRGSKYRVGLIVLGACVLMLASCATTKTPTGLPGAPVVSQLEYRHDADMMKDMNVGSSYNELSRRAREKLTGEPAYVSRKPLYGHVKLGNGKDTKYTFVIDESHGTRSGYDTFYIDANNNQDLTDDPKLVGTFSADNPFSAEFPTAELKVECDGKTYTYHVKPHVYSSNRASVSLASAGYCQGQVTLDGKTYKVAVFDDLMNGCFNDLYASPQEYGRSGSIYGVGDTMMIDLNGDGKFDKKTPYTPEVFHLGKYLPWGGRCYEVKVSADGRSLSLTESTAPSGYIKTHCASYSAELLGEDGTVKLQGEARVKVPAGKYRLATCTAEAKDKEGKTWRLTGAGSWKHPEINVQAGKVTPLSFGPPLVAKVTYSRTNPSEIGFNLQLTGVRNEEYTAGGITRDGEGLPPPRFEVRDSKGDMVTSGSFQYG